MGEFWKHLEEVENARRDIEERGNRIRMVGLSV